MKKPADIDTYIAGFPGETQRLLEQVRATIRKAVPMAEETISYAMPAFRLNGKVLIYFAGYAHHIGLYPTASGIAAFKKDLSAYKSSKGAVQFPLDKKLPLALITRMVTFRAKESTQRTRSRKVKARR